MDRGYLEGSMKVGDLVRVIICQRFSAEVDDVVLLLENLGKRKYFGTEPGLLFRGMLVSSPEDTDYYVFEHDVEVINENR